MIQELSVPDEPVFEIRGEDRDGKSNFRDQIVVEGDSISVIESTSVQNPSERNYSLQDGKLVLETTGYYDAEAVIQFSEPDIPDDVSDKSIDTGVSWMLIESVESDDYKIDYYELEMRGTDYQRWELAHSDLGSITIQIPSQHGHEVLASSVCENCGEGLRKHGIDGNEVTQSMCFECGLMKQNTDVPDKIADVVDIIRQSGIETTPSEVDF